VPPKRRRLTAEARKSSILAAARRAFTETGDMNGTTIKLIAERSGISEGVIYRHFESKDQLFFEAVVEPLKQAVDELVAASAMVDRDEPLTPQRQLETMVGLLPAAHLDPGRDTSAAWPGAFRRPAGSQEVLPGEFRGGDGPAGRGVARGRGPLRLPVRVAGTFRLAR